jgi:hypothetical protein
MKISSLIDHSEENLMRWNNRSKRCFRFFPFSFIHSIRDKKRQLNNESGNVNEIRHQCGEKFSRTKGPIKQLRQ